MLAGSWSEQQAPAQSSSAKVRCHYTLPGQKHYVIGYMLCAQSCATCLHLYFRSLPTRQGYMSYQAMNAPVCADNTGYVTVRLPSGEQRLVLERCMATIGSLSNAQHKNRKLGRAGANRWLGRRPVVRGVAMNSVDHPHGGGR